MGVGLWNDEKDNRTTGAVAADVVISNDVVTVAADAAATLTAAQLVGGIIEGPISLARTYTTDTGANLDAAFTNPKNGDHFRCLVESTASAAVAITLAAGTGVTIKGNTAIAQNKAAILDFVRTAPATWTCYSTVGA